jgi:hypothetical protein
MQMTEARRMPHPILTKIVGKPTYASLTIARRELYSNGASIPTTRGDGLKGHAVIVLGQAEYLRRAGQPFVIPGNPGPPPTPRVNATEQAMAREHRRYEADTKDFEVYTALENTLKQQLFAAIDEIYYLTLIDPETGTSDHTLFQILTHLFEKHGKMTDEDIMANENKLYEAYVPIDTMDPLFAKANEIVAIGQSVNATISDGHVIRALKKVLSDTGVFSTAIEKWNAKTEADKTWANFQTHFSKANDVRLETLAAMPAAGNAGFVGGHAANAATQPPTVQQPVAMQQPQANAPTGESMPGWFYCWTHGLGKNPKHTSCTCKNKAQGHREDATLDNMKGGSHTIATGRAPRNNNRTAQHDNTNNNN